jgi:hypothetical protein
MRALVAFVAAIVGAALLLRGVADWGLGLFAFAAAIAAWRFVATPLRRIEVALAAGLTIVGVAQGHVVDGVCAAAIVVSLIELARIFR